MPSKIRFGVFELDHDAAELRKHGIRVRLQDQPFQVLAYLLERPGQIVTPEELKKRIWAEDTFVDFDQSLNKAVNRLREALNDDAGQPRYIETVPRRGYRFVAPVAGPGPDEDLCSTEGGGLRMLRNVITVVCFLLAASFSSAAQSKNDPEKLAGALKGDNKGAAARNKLCKLFTMSEAGSYVGATIHNMDNAAMGTGCQWTVGGNNGSMLVQVVPARYHDKPSGAPGYKKLPEIGPQAFVVPEMGGWHAGSLQGAHAVHVMLSGKGASEARTIELLKESIKREAAVGEK